MLRFAKVSRIRFLENIVFTPLTFSMFLKWENRVHQGGHQPVWIPQTDFDTMIIFRGELQLPDRSLVPTGHYVALHLCSLARPREKGRSRGGKKAVRSEGQLITPEDRLGPVPWDPPLSVCLALLHPSIHSLSCTSISLCQRHVTQLRPGRGSRCQDRLLITGRPAPPVPFIHQASGHLDDCWPSPQPNWTGSQRGHAGVEEMRWDNKGEQSASRSAHSCNPACSRYDPARVRRPNCTAGRNSHLCANRR